jgi:N-glycosylase/DNA lyase
MKRTLFLETPENFSFRQTIYSHGWSELLPFRIDEENWILSYAFCQTSLREQAVQSLPTENQPAYAGYSDIVFVVISEADGKLKIETDGNAESDEKILRDISRILRFDEDLSGFYKILKSEKRLNWIAEKSAGRLLRSPTVFEDLVKTICTTNCSWSLTKTMVRNLVEKLGTDGRSFPTAAQMAEVSDDFYRDEIRAGYRSPYFVELAKKVAEGKLNPEAWLTSDLPTKELKKAMKQVKGVGDYAAENLLKLVGRYDGLALDSFLRSEFYKKHNNETPCDDKKIHDFYEKFGEWRGLVIWCDMTERWF